MSHCESNDLVMLVNGEVGVLTRGHHLLVLISDQVIDLLILLI